MKIPKHSTLIAILPIAFVLACKDTSDAVAPRAVDVADANPVYTASDFNTLTP